MMKTVSILVVALLVGAVASAQAYAASFQHVFSESYSSGTLSAYVSNVGNVNETWRFVASTNSGETLSVDHVTSSGFTTLTYAAADGVMQSEFAASSGHAEGWIEFVGGSLNGFYSDTWGNISDPFWAPPGGGFPPGMVQSHPGLSREMLALVHELEELGEGYQLNGYLECVGSVAAGIGSTIFGTQHHQGNVRGHRAGQVTRVAVRASGVALGAVVIGGAAVSAAICTGVFMQ